MIEQQDALEAMHQYSKNISGTLLHDATQSQRNEMIALAQSTLKALSGNGAEQSNLVVFGAGFLVVESISKRFYDSMAEHESTATDNDQQIGESERRGLSDFG